MLSAESESCAFCGASATVVSTPTAKRILADTQAIRETTSILASAKNGPTSDTLMNENSYQCVADLPDGGQLFGRLASNSTVQWYASDSTGERFSVAADYVNRVLSAGPLPEWRTGTGLTRCPRCGAKYHFTKSLGGLASLMCMQCLVDVASVQAALRMAREQVQRVVSEARDVLEAPSIGEDDSNVVPIDLHSRLVGADRTFERERARADFVMRNIGSVLEPVRDAAQWREWAAMSPRLSLGLPSEYAPGGRSLEAELEVSSQVAQTVHTDSLAEELQAKSDESMALLVARRSGRNRRDRMLSGGLQMLFPGTIFAVLLGGMAWGNGWGGFWGWFVGGMVAAFLLGALLNGAFGE